MFKLALPFEVKNLLPRDPERPETEGVFQGLASTFHNVDLVGDVIEPGAFAASETQPEKVKLLWQHDLATPLGVIENLKESAQGLEVHGRLVLEVQKAREAHALLQAGAITGLSIGFSVPKKGAFFDTARNVRVLKAIDLHEVSLVTFPANPSARVLGVKSGREEATMPTERELEACLREAGLSRKKAKALLAGGYTKALAPVRADEGESELIAALQAAKHTLTIS